LLFGLACGFCIANVYANILNLFGKLCEIGARWLSNEWADAEQLCAECFVDGRLTAQT